MPREKVPTGNEQERLYSTENRSNGTSLIWMQKFAAGVAAKPLAYHLSVSEVATIRNAVEALSPESNPLPQSETRSMGDETNHAWTTAAQICRQFATLIKYNSSISDSDKSAIGIRPVTRAKDRFEAKGGREL